MLQRMRTLAVQANNGINTSDDKQAITDEVTQLTNEIARIAEKTTYGGKTILKGHDANAATPDDIYNNTSVTQISGSSNRATIDFQVGANSGDTISLDVSSFSWSNMTGRAIEKLGGGNVNAASMGMIAASSVNGIDYNLIAKSNGGKSNYAFDFTKDGNAGKAIAAIDAMLADVDSQRSTLGSIQNRLESTIRVQSNVATNESDARSRIRDTDFAEESANLSQQSIIQQAATSMLMQANARPQIGLSLLG